MSRSFTIAGFLAVLLLTVSSAVSAQVAPVQPDSARLPELALLRTFSPVVSRQVAPLQPDSARLHEAVSIPRLVAGGLIGGAVGTLAPLLLVPKCASPVPPDNECSDVLRDVAAGLGYLVGVPIGVHIAGGRRTSLLRPLVGSLMVSGMLGLFAHGMEPSIAYAIPAVHLVISVGAAR